MLRRKIRAETISMPEIGISGAQLYYEMSGTGEPILLIPGLGMDHTYYRLGAPLLAQRMRVIAVDPRGIGGSTKSPPPYSVEGWADDFAAMIDRLGVGPIHLPGPSPCAPLAPAPAQRLPPTGPSLLLVG